VLGAVVDVVHGFTKFVSIGGQPLQRVFVTATRERGEHCTFYNIFVPRRRSNELTCEVGSFGEILAYLETVQYALDTRIVVSESAKGLGVGKFLCASFSVIVILDRHLGLPHKSRFDPTAPHPIFPVEMGGFYNLLWIRQLL
jgi:hypothetical protein